MQSISQSCDLPDQSDTSDLAPGDPEVKCPDPEAAQPSFQLSTPGYHDNETTSPPTNLTQLCDVEKSADFEHMVRSADEHVARSADFDHVTICAPEDMSIRFIDSQAGLKG